MAENEADPFRDHDREMFHQRTQQPDALGTFGMMLAVWGALFPALSHTRYFLPLGLDLPAVLAVSGLCCTVGFCLLYPDRRFWFAGLLPGLITGPLVAGVLVLFTASQTQIHSGALVIVMLVAGAPGFVLYYYSLRSLVLQDVRRRRDAGETDVW